MSVRKLVFEFNYRYVEKVFIIRIGVLEKDLNSFTQLYFRKSVYLLQYYYVCETYIDVR